MDNYQYILGLYINDPRVPWWFDEVAIGMQGPSEHKMVTGSGFGLGTPPPTFQHPKIEQWHQIYVKALHIIGN